MKVGKKNRRAVKRFVKNNIKVMTMNIVMTHAQLVMSWLMLMLNNAQLHRSWTKENWACAFRWFFWNQLSFIFTFNDYSHWKSVLKWESLTYACEAHVIGEAMIIKEFSPFPFSWTRLSRFLTSHASPLFFTP